MASRIPEQGAAPRVLIVEDEPLIALATRQLLSRAGYAVVGLAATGPDAVAQFTRLVEHGDAPDAVLMDIRLRGPMDGVDTALSLRDCDPRPAIIFVSASLDRVSGPRAEQARPDAVLSKPYADRVLLSTLEGALAARGMPAERAMSHA
ncbi:MAG TPA: response regulator [Acetobacteraceae bacterium]|nr:response regulator [Acetobacteraceae bacterium]